MGTIGPWRTSLFTCKTQGQALPEAVGWAWSCRKWELGMDHSRTLPLWNCSGGCSHPLLFVGSTERGLSFVRTNLSNIKGWGGCPKALHHEDNAANRAGPGQHPAGSFLLGITPQWGTRTLWGLSRDGGSGDLFPQHGVSPGVGDIPTDLG